jgi:hypothetical protein
MSRRLLAAVAAASVLGSTQALAGTASISFTDFQVSVLDLTGAASPLSTVVFSGGDSADAAITGVPYNPYPGPPGWTGYEQGLTTSPGAFDTVLSLGEIDVDAAHTYGIVAYFAGLTDPAPVGSITASGGASFDGSYSTFAMLTLGGTSFLLAPHSELVVSTSLSMSASDGYAGVALDFAGPQGSAWSDAVANGSFSDDVSLVFRNDSDVAVTDAFSASFTASSVPEPATPALLLLGATLLLTRRKFASIRSPGRLARIQNE